MSDDIDDVRPPEVTAPGEASPYRRAHDLLAAREPAAALLLLEPALETAPHDRGLRSLRAWAFLMRAQLVRAESDLARLVEEDPADAWARHALGRALERQSRPAEALPHLRLAAAMTGDVEHGAVVRRVEASLAAS